jgi:hypothetical protein
VAAAVVGVTMAQSTRPPKHAQAPALMSVAAQHLEMPQVEEAKGAVVVSGEERKILVAVVDRCAHWSCCHPPWRDSWQALIGGQWATPGSEGWPWVG